METPKSTVKKRNFCAVCSNYRGRIVDDRVITLHRFPADQELNRIWVKRFDMGRILDCSAHFVNGEMTKDNSVPSIFKLTSGKKKVFALSKVSSYNE